MINGIKLKDNLSPNQRRIRLMELSGITITEREKKRLLNESVSMVEIPKNRTQVVPKKPQQEPYEDEIDLDEILREMGYYEEEEDDSISNMSREELKQMIQDIVLDTMDEEEELHEIIENLTKNY